MSAAVVRKKQDDKHLQALRELVTTGGGGCNRQCFDCGQKGPTYVNMTIGSFVCTRCSGVLRGLTPPHRVKSISMATFTQEEIDFIRAHGNELCAKTWLGLWDPKRTMHQDHRELMIDKYERKRYYLEPASPLKSLTNAATISPSAISALSNENSNHMAGLTNGKQLTPPPSQRNCNGLTTVNGRNRPHHHHQQHQQQQQQDVTSNRRLSINGSTSSSGAFSADASSFSGESEFVANFGAANIYDATSEVANNILVHQPASPATISIATYTNANNSNSNNNHNHNGYAKIRSIHQNQSLLNNSSNNNNSENFADFDHAPIYNATTVSLPMPNCVNKSLNSSSSNASNKYTPDVDRYAALKDLDEQLREIKATSDAINVDTKILDAYSSNNNILNSNNNDMPAAGNLNPFKGQQQQLQQQQQHQTGDNGGLVNPFAIHSMSNPIAVIPSNSSVNYHLQPSAGYLNYYNGVGISMATPMTSGPNGCGFGTMQQKIVSNNGMLPVGVFNNPFSASATAGALNTNNPFL